MLVASKAYVVKKVGSTNGRAGADDAEAAPVKSGQVTWSKNGGPEKAWSLAKHRANFI